MTRTALPPIRTAAPIPAALREIAQILHDAGHEAVLVGGAVRDVLLGRAHGDWDLASSATPEEVQTLFKKTIPTGVAHGTVTVVSAPGQGTEVEMAVPRAPIS